MPQKGDTRMAVNVSVFDHLTDGQAVEKVELVNSNGTKVSILTLGATIQSLVYDGLDVVLGFDSAANYFTSGAYIGATVGRVCNRTADGAFTMGGHLYKLQCNEPGRQVHLHGGCVGFDKKLWQCTVLSDKDDPSAAFEMISEDGDEGYPGNLKVRLVYTLTASDALLLDYTATTDADTPLNLTNHVYFNLNGCDGDTICNHKLRINAQEYTPVTQRLVPTGEYAAVANTSIDFRSLRTIGDALTGTDACMPYTGGVDHNFVLAKDRGNLIEAAVAYSPSTGICVTCHTDLPGIQVYTGNFLDESGGKYGLKWGKHQGFCLETQYFPNSVNLPQFPSIILRAGDTFISRTSYRLSKIGEVE